MTRRHRELSPDRDTKLIEQMSEHGGDGRPNLILEDALLDALWREHKDKMPKLARLRWEADHESEIGHDSE